MEKATIVNIEQIAKTCHEVNRAYCQATGDMTQPSWEDAPEWQKKSCMDGVEFHLNNPHSKPEDSHDNWLREKTADGWSYGPVKDPEKKQHPCFIPYNQLPLEQQVKDFLFIAVVRSFPHHFDLKLNDTLPIGDASSV